jgi:hypothetical protein
VFAYQFASAALSIQRWLYGSKVIRCEARRYAMRNFAREPQESALAAPPRDYSMPAVWPNRRR